MEGPRNMSSIAADCLLERKMDMLGCSGKRTEFAQGCRVRKWQSHDSNPDLLDAKFI